jgi:DNA replication protein DnaC
MEISKIKTIIDSVFGADGAGDGKLRGDLGWLLSKVGERYWDCTVESFVADTKDKIRFVDTIKDYIANIKTYYEEGNGLLIFGSVGTGKDHMATAVAKELFRAGYQVEWINGLLFRSRVRDLIDSPETELEFAMRYTKPDFLWFSDPFTAGEPMTSYQKEFLLRVIDARYQKRKPIIWTCNASTKKEFEDAVGAAAFDRMRADAVRCFCNWESFRKPRI